ncbi:hypothetical protein EJ110_NYTH47953 [Nymphaea thermarum]|nr:hypothetical protein EJ110_NYTH47953 [Nymphaea thermarum]
MFYAPVLFKTLGFGDDASLMSAVISGLVNVIATFVSIATVDKFGRRALFLEGGPRSLDSHGFSWLLQVLVGIVLGKTFGVSGTGHLAKGTADFVLFLICAYVAAFAWSWGPLGWLVPSEIFPLEVFLTMLCHLKFGLFFFFAGWVLLMTVFIFFFLPETKNVPIEEMVLVWRQHWFWGKVQPDENVGSV